MKKLISTLMLLGIQNTFAAQFETIVKSTNQKIDTISKTLSEIVENKSIYGECSGIKTYEYVKNDTEKDINTIKQLMIESGTLMTDYDEYSYVTDVTDISTFFTAENLLDPTFSYSEDRLEDILVDDEITQVENDRTKMAKMIYSLLKDKDKGVLLFDGLHSFEDGTWNVLSIMDKINQQITVYTVGVCGTKSITE